MLYSLFGHAIAPNALRFQRRPRIEGIREQSKGKRRASEGQSKGIRVAEQALRKRRSEIPFFAVFFPVLTTLNISSSAIPLTFGSGTENLAAFSFRLFFTKPRSVNVA